MSATTRTTDTTEARAKAAMLSLVGSLADNKAALGTRYAEWAVSAPTLESAVAAAAMAQDELGHSRSTYPVLKALGAGVTQDAPFGGDRRLALLDSELEDWTAAVAANLLVDGVLTTFVAACADSTITPMAQRARKILQEEGSHRIHAEAWAKRLCRSGEVPRSALVQRLTETWEQAGRWTGPAERSRGAGSAGAGHDLLRRTCPAGLDADLAAGAARRRGRGARALRTDRLLPLGPRAPPMEPLTQHCPFCGAAHTERVGQWGGQMITEQRRCHACASYFEAIRDDFAGDVPQVTPDIREPDDTRL